jgi:NAD(P)-dependent dehydrogenase (short-subunit alcohol dehydrogenase family)
MTTHVTLVTGAAGALGMAISAALLERGGALVLSDVDEQALEVARRHLSSGSGRVVAIPGDVTSDSETAELVREAIRQCGRVDACVNNAGIEGPVSPVEELELAAVRRVFDVNVFGTFRVTKEVIRHFKERGGGGRIVNIASGAGLAGNPFMAPYSASKHAVVGFTRSIAGEVAKDGISVNAVCPGCVESPMINRITDNLSVCTGRPVSFVESIPFGRYARPHEIGDVVAYLAVDAPLYLTGTTIVIDGGLRA